MNDNLSYRIENQYNQIDFLLKGLTKTFLIKRHRPEKWSIHENLAHLGRYQEVFEDRMNQILRVENPLFGRYKAEEDPRFEDWVALQPFDLIEKTKHQRQELALFLLALNDQQLTRTGAHPILGSMNIATWVEFFLLHENHHFYTILWLVQEFDRKS